MYKTHTLEEYQEAMKLRKEFGWGAKRISSFLSHKDMFVKRGTIAGWIYQNKLPFEERIVTQILKTSKQLSVDKGYILGVLCGDGFMTSGYRIGLDVCDFDFIREFDRCVYSVYGLHLTIKQRSRSTNFSKQGRLQYCGMLVSKNCYKDLLKYSSSFRTREWIVPKEILDSDNLKIKSAFLKGIFDSGGTIRLKKKGHAYLQICSGNNRSLMVIKEMLSKDFNIDMGVKYNQAGVMVLYSERYKNIKNFSDKIGFTIGRKQQMLVFCLSCYKRKGLRSYDEKFKLKVLELLDKEYSAYRIGKMLDFPYTNVYDFVKQRDRL